MSFMESNIPPPIREETGPIGQDLSPVADAARPPERPFWAAWITVIIVFLALTGSSIYAIVAPSGRDSIDLRTEISGIRMSYVLRASNPIGMSPLTAEEKRTQENALRDAIKRAQPAAGKDETAALLTLFSERELGLKLTAPAIAKLRKSEDKLNVAIAEFYDSGKPDATKSRALADSLEDENGVLTLIRYHALQSAGDKDAFKNAFQNTNQLLLIGGLGLVMLGVFLGGLIAILVYFLNRSNHPAPLHPVRVVSAQQAGLLGLVVVLMFIGSQVLIGIAGGIEAAIKRAQTGEMPEINLGSPMIAVGGLMFIALLTVTLTKWNWNGESMWEQLHRPTMSNKMLVVWGVAGYMANFPMLALSLVISQPLMRFFPPSHEAADLVRQTQSPMVLLVLLILAGVVAPFWEEIAFRGFLFRGLNHHMPWIASGVISSLAFASIHQQGPAMWLGLGWVGFMGCILTRQTGSVWPAVLMHALHNSTLLVIGSLTSNVF